MAQAETGDADFIQRDTAELARQPHRAANFILDPGHADFVGAHVRTEDILLDFLQRAAESADQRFFLRPRHFRVADQYRFAAAVGQARGGALESHRARQPGTLLEGRVRRHAHAADRRSARDVIDHQDAFEANSGLVYVNYLQRPQVVGKFEHVLHSEFLLAASINSTFSYVKFRRSLISIKVAAISIADSGRESDRSECENVQ